MTLLFWHTTGLTGNISHDFPSFELLCIAVVEHVLARVVLNGPSHGLYIYIFTIVVIFDSIT